MKKGRSEREGMVAHGMFPSPIINAYYALASCQDLLLYLSTWTGFKMWLSPRNTKCIWRNFFSLIQVLTGQCHSDGGLGLHG